MPAPTTIDELLDVVRKSGVIDEKRLTAHLDKLRAADQVPTEPLKLAQRLVDDGLLTRFQVEQFLQGKWRRFTLGKYKVLERLGSGGMGSVYLCEHIMMRRRVAVKVLPTSKAEDSSCLERFYREARAVAALDHPNIVRAYDIDQEENLHFLVMEHVDGSSFQEIVKRAGPMDVLRAAHYIRQAALGLQHAHETANLVHRDVKPGNILVDRNGIVKLLDMGLARFFNDDEDDLTKKYDENVLGTADYLAPEQALDSHSVDIRADVYSLGGTFYFCLTGRTPFAEGSVAQKLIWHQTRQPKPIRGLRPEVPEGIVAIIDRMMAKDPGGRFQTPQEVADALAPFTQTPIPPPPEREMPQFSLAAAPRSFVGEPGSGSTKPASDVVPPSPPPRKGGWQVAGATSAAPPAQPAAPRSPAPARPAPAPAPAPTAAPAAQRPALASAPTPAPTAPVPPRPAIAAPVARAQPANATPSPTGNGPARSAPAMELPPAAPPRAERPVAFTRAPTPQPAPVPTATADDDQEMPTFSSGGVAADAVRRRAAASRKPQEKRSLLPLLILGIVGGAVVFVVILLLGVGAALGWFSSGPPDKGEEKKPTRRIVVKNQGLAALLYNARPGDVYVLPDNVSEDSVHVTVDNVTIEAEEGKTVTWKCPGKALPQSRLLHIDGAANVTIRNVTFDADNRAESCIMIYSKCTGTKLENLQLKNYRHSGVYVTTAEGTEDKPVLLDRLKFQNEAGKIGVFFTMHGKLRKADKHFVISECEFAGPGKAVVVDRWWDGDGDPSADVSTIDFPAGKVEVLPKK